MLNQDVEGMPYVLCFIVLGILVDESTRVDIQILKKYQPLELVKYRSRSLV